MTHAAESTHWYDRAGQPAYTVKAKDGTDRPCTLRDARKLALVPSVTSIIRCAAAPGLEYWKTQQAILAALTLPKREDEPEAVYLARILADSKEQAKKAAERGTGIHAALQGFYEGEDYTGFEPYAQATQAAIDEWAGEEMFDMWTAERAFANALGFGGKCDLSYLPAPKRQADCFFDGAVIDFKTKEFDTFNDLKTWDEHAYQLAAYRHGLGIPKARCAIVYVSTTVPGLAKLIEIPEEDLARGWTCFYSLLHFWQAKNTYRSSFEALAA